jgi:hypothetical protein
MRLFPAIGYGLAEKSRHHFIGSGPIRRRYFNLFNKIFRNNVAGRMNEKKFPAGAKRVSSFLKQHHPHGQTQ